MSKAVKTRSRIITVYQGLKLWSPGSPIRAPSIDYMIRNGSTVADAFTHAKGLLAYLSDFSNRSFLQNSMLQAQRSGIYSPLVSTSRNRSVARSFALNEGRPGYILTIEGPEDAFYDFNKIRDDNGLPHPTEYRWLEEMGIPLELKAPFEIISVDQIHGVTENKINVYTKSTP